MQTNYNERLVRRGEIFISRDILKNWNKDLAKMNRNKRGRPYQYPDTLIRTMAYAKQCYGLAYRQTEGLFRAYDLPCVPDYTLLQKRIASMKIKIPARYKKKKNTIIAVDSTGFKVTNSGEWMRSKWNGKRKGFLKMHIAVDVKTGEILVSVITDEHSHDSPQLEKLVKQASKHGTISAVLADGAYDSYRGFSYLSDQKITPGIRVRKNSVPKSRGCRAHKLAVIAQFADYKKWAASVSYGKRWRVESTFSALKRIFGEAVRSKNKKNMATELMLRIMLYNQFLMA